MACEVVDDFVSLGKLLDYLSISEIREVRMAVAVVPDHVPVDRYLDQVPRLLLGHPTGREECAVDLPIPKDVQQARTDRNSARVEGQRHLFPGGVTPRNLSKVHAVRHRPCSI